MSSSAKKKPSIIKNSFEQVGELGRDTAKSVATEVVKTFIPMAEHFGNPTKEVREQGNENFTDLDFEALQKKYGAQDHSQLDEVRRQLGGQLPEEQMKEQHDAQFHRKYRQEEERYHVEKEQQEADKERQEAYEAQERQRIDEEEARKRQQESGIPKGKVRKTILGGKGHKKATSEIPAEFRPSAGKQ